VYLLELVHTHQRNGQKHQQHRGRLDPALTHASHLTKPQLRFKHTPSNTDESPYIPSSLIPHKWCAKVPLGYVFHDAQPRNDAEDNRNEDVEEEERTKRTIHPYYYELTHPSYPNHVFNPPSNPSHPSSLEISSLACVSTSSTSSSHPLTFVSTPKDLLALANAISTANELAIDLEHHSYRSYKGFLALMQISTREADFVVDLLVPDVREGLRQGKGKSTGEGEEERMAREAGQVIARVFADPSVIKVHLVSYNRFIS
jgi:exosome complex exonuclease RRP6